MTFAVWGGFIAGILVLLAFDLFILHRRARVLAPREALLTTLMWVGVSLSFTVVVYFLYTRAGLNLSAQPPPGEPGSGYRSALLPASGTEAAMMYLTGYLVELLLSLDNMLVIALILASFRIPAPLQHRVLFWGIIGAVVLRGAMIVGGAALVGAYGQWVLPAFGVILILSAFKTLITREDEADIERNLIVRAARRFFNITPRYDGDKFLARVDGRLFFTPLMVALLVVDVADFILAIESIPAVFGITTDPFLVFSSNCFAVLGLRSIYFSIAGPIRRFRYLKVCTVFVLGYVGIKMLADRWYHVSPQSSLVTIAAILAIGVVASLVAGPRDRLPEDRPIDDLTVAAEEAWRRSRKVVILILGLTIVFIAAPLVGFLPGPGGIFVAIGGLALLATEFVWARKLLTTMKHKAMQVTGHGPTTKPPRLWHVAAVLIGYGVFVVLLVWAERTWGHKFPMLDKNWFYLAIGPGIAVTYWSVMTLRRWIKLRSRSTAWSNPAADATSGELASSTDSSAASSTSEKGLGGQRQRAGSTPK